MDHFLAWSPTRKLVVSRLLSCLDTVFDVTSNTIESGLNRDFSVLTLKTIRLKQNQTAACTYTGGVEQLVVRLCSSECVVSAVDVRRVNISVYIHQLSEKVNAASDDEQSVLSLFSCQLQQLHPKAVLNLMDVKVSLKIDQLLSGDALVMETTHLQIQPHNTMIERQPQNFQLVSHNTRIFLRSDSFIELPIIDLFPFAATFELEDHKSLQCDFEVCCGQDSSRLLKVSLPLRVIKLLHCLYQCSFFKSQTSSDLETSIQCKPKMARPSVASVAFVFPQIQCTFPEECTLSFGPSALFWSSILSSFCWIGGRTIDINEHHTLILKEGYYWCVDFCHRQLVISKESHQRTDTKAVENHGIVRLIEQELRLLTSSIDSVLNVLGLSKCDFVEGWSVSLSSGTDIELRAMNGEWLKGCVNGFKYGVSYFGKSAYCRMESMTIGPTSLGGFVIVLPGVSFLSENKALRVLGKSSVHTQGRLRLQDVCKLTYRLTKFLACIKNAMQCSFLFMPEIDLSSSNYSGVLNELQISDSVQCDSLRLVCGNDLCRLSVSGLHLRSWSQIEVDHVFVQLGSSFGIIKGLQTERLLLDDPHTSTLALWSSHNFYLGSKKEFSLDIAKFQLQTSTLESCESTLTFSPFQAVCTYDDDIGTVSFSENLAVLFEAPSEGSIYTEIEQMSVAISTKTALLSSLTCLNISVSSHNESELRVFIPAICMKGIGLFAVDGPVDIRCQQSNVLKENQSLSTSAFRWVQLALEKFAHGDNVSLIIPRVEIKISNLETVIAKDVNFMGKSLIYCSHLSVMGATGSTLSGSSVCIKYNATSCAFRIAVIETMYIPSICALSSTTRDVWIVIRKRCLSVRLSSASILLLQPIMNGNTGALNVFCKMQFEFKRLTLVTAERDVLQAKCAFIELPMFVGDAFAFTFRADSVSTSFIQLLDPRLSGVVDCSAAKSIPLLNFEPGSVIVTAGLDAFDWIRYWGQKDKRTKFSQWRMPDARICSFPLQLAFDINVASTFCAIFIRSLNCEPTATAGDICYYYATAILREIPSLYCNARVMGESATDITLKAAGRLVCSTTAVSACGSVTALVLGDSCRTILALGRESQGLSLETKFRFRDALFGLYYSFKAIALRGGCLQQGESGACAWQLNNFGTAFSDTLHQYAEKNKGRFGEAGGSVIGMTIGGAFYGILGLFFGQYIGGKAGSKLFMDGSSCRDDSSEEARKLQTQLPILEENVDDWVLVGTLHKKQKKEKNSPVQKCSIPRLGGPSKVASIPSAPMEAQHRYVIVAQGSGEEIVSHSPAQGIPEKKRMINSFGQLLQSKASGFRLR